MKALEALGVDEYYQTLSTWMRILDEKKEAVNKGGEGNDDGKQRRRLKGK